MLRYEDPPNKLVIHIGGSDIGKVRLGYLQYQLKELFVWLSQMFTPILCNDKFTPPGRFLASTNAFLTSDDPTIQTVIGCPVNLI
jgi:hypothetical protein